MRRGNGEGSVFKLGGKRRKPWAVRVTVGWTEQGKQKLKYIGYYRTKVEAKEALREFLVNPYDLNNDKITLLDIFEKWKDNNDLSEKSLLNYTQSFNRAKHLHNFPIKDLKVGHIEMAINELTPSMGKLLRNTLNQLFLYAMKHEIVDKNIVQLVKAKENENKKVKVPFTLEQINAIKSFEHPYTDTAIILLYTGLRIRELLEIENKNIFLDKRYMVGGLKTSSGKNRIIPIHDEIFELIKRRYNPDRKYLICYENGSKIPYLKYRRLFWDRMQTALNFKQTPHEARHTFITQADKCHLDRLAVQRIVGHKSKEMTDHYTHRTTEELITEINKLKYE